MNELKCEKSKKNLWTKCAYMVNINKCIKSKIYVWKWKKKIQTYHSNEAHLYVSG